MSSYTLTCIFLTKILTHIFQQEYFQAASNMGILMILAQVETPEASTFAFLCKAKIKQAKGFFLALKSASPFCKTSFSNQIKPNSLAKKMQNSILQRRIHQHNFPLQNTKLSSSPWLSSSFPMMKSVGGSLRGYLNIQHPPTPEKLNFCL